MQFKLQEVGDMIREQRRSLSDVTGPPIPETSFVKSVVSDKYSPIHGLLRKHRPFPSLPK